MDSKGIDIPIREGVDKLSKGVSQDQDGTLLPEEDVNFVMDEHHETTDEER